MFVVDPFRVPEYCEIVLHIIEEKETSVIRHAILKLNYL